MCRAKSNNWGELHRLEPLVRLSFPDHLPRRSAGLETGLELNVQQQSGCAECGLFTTALNIIESSDLVW